MIAFLVIALVGMGLFFSASAALGIFRFPDVLSRMHAVTKAGTLGVGLTMVAVAVYFSHDLSIVTRALAVVVFTLVTAPVSAQMIGRAAYLNKCTGTDQLSIDAARTYYLRKSGLPRLVKMSSEVAISGEASMGLETSRPEEGL